MKLPSGIVTHIYTRGMKQGAKVTLKAAHSWTSDPVLKGIGVGVVAGTGIGAVASRKKDKGFFGHAKVNKQDIVKNPPPQPSQFGKDGFYSSVQNCEGKL